MKDNLFELLFNLFEKSLSQVQEKHEAKTAELSIQEQHEESDADRNALYIQQAQRTSTRVFTYNEQMKMTKASYQFLMKMKLWGIVDAHLFELIMDELDSSDSRIITLQEAKWTIRNVLAKTLDEEQLAFLDLVLYQKEDELTVH